MWMWVYLRCLCSMDVLEHEYCYLKNRLHELFQVTIFIQSPLPLPISLLLSTKSEAQGSHLNNFHDSSNLQMEQQRVMAARVRYRLLQWKAYVRESLVFTCIYISTSIDSDIGFVQKLCIWMQRTGSSTLGLSYIWLYQMFSSISNCFLVILWCCSDPCMKPYFRSLYHLSILTVRPVLNILHVILSSSVYLLIFFFVVVLDLM